MNNLVSTNWLNRNLKKNDIIILDCTWHLQNIGKNALNEYNIKHIKNAQFVDIEKISNKNTKLPHMVVSRLEFQKFARNLGINIDSKIIVYDSLGIFSSPRIWWMFKYFGHNNVYVLNGGLKKWIKENKPTSKKINKNKKGNFKAIINKSLITNYTHILKNLKNNKLLILDARNRDRYKGLSSEPRKGLRKGHIPGSQNLYWGDLLNNNGTIKTKYNLKKIFKMRNIAQDKEIITSCGSGITACIISLALLHCNNIKSQIYDGSWSEWGGKRILPIEK